VARAVQLVFGFAVLAGLAVLYAALQASADERRHELAVLRALGARRSQLASALLAEFAVLGALAGLLAGCREPDRLGAGALRVSPRLSAAGSSSGWLGALAGMVLVLVAGWLGVSPHVAPVRHAGTARGGLSSFATGAVLL
jgi:putative ABC transport system permease protein